MKVAPLACLLTALAPASTTATTWHIMPDGTGDAPTIQAAIDLANAGDIIELADGVFRGPGNRDIDYRDKNVAVQSASGDPDHCTIDCEGLGRGFWISSGMIGPNTALKDVRITNGSSPEWGSGIYVGWCNPTITGCVIEANICSGTWGSGVSFHQSDATMEDCVIAGNTGGHFNAQVVSVGYSGPGPTLRDCLIADSDSAGVRAVGTTIALIGCTIVRNASHGVTTAPWNTAIISLENTIIALNGGQAVQCTGGSIGTACSNLFGNAGGDWVGCLAGQGASNGNFSADPFFCDPANGDFTIQSDSPCAPPGITGCGLVGALPVACGPVALRAESWARVKARYR